MIKIISLIVVLLSGFPVNAAKPNKTDSPSFNHNCPKGTKAILYDTFLYEISDPEGKKDTASVFIYECITNKKGGKK